MRAIRHAQAKYHYINEVLNNDGKMLSKAYDILFRK